MTDYNNIINGDDFNEIKRLLKNYINSNESLSSDIAFMYDESEELDEYMVDDFIGDYLCGGVENEDVDTFIQSCFADEIASYGLSDTQKLFKIQRNSFSGLLEIYGDENEAIDWCRYAENYNSYDAFVCAVVKGDEIELVSYNN